MQSTEKKSTELTGEQKRIQDLKEKFLAYFKELPLQNLACAYIGRDDDTISRWKKDDAEFAEQVDNAKAEWAMKNVKRVRSKEWLLERVMRDNFSQRQELTGKEGKDLPTPIIQLSDVHRNDSNKKD